jgi:hypothetical protein
MNVITGLLLIVAVIVFTPVALAMAFVVGISVASEARVRLGQRRAMRQVDELLRGES